MRQPGAGRDSGELYGFGAWPDSKGETRFRFWAPSVDGVHLVLEGSKPRPMKKLDDGFHEVVCAAPPGTRYRYGLPDGRLVPDPASRMQAGDVHDASVVCDLERYVWKNENWKGRPWSETVLYELHCGLHGGFKGVEQRLPELQKLGITAIELMPVADFPGPRNWGYDGVLPYAPDSAYGTPQELQALIDTAHGLGLMVFLDVVYNHFGPDGNYLPGYAPEFFRDDLNTPWGPAIDFRQDAVRQFFAENALYWLREYRFDGLRLDAVHAISDKTWLPEMASFVRRQIGPERHIHLVLENDDNAAGLLRQGFDAQWNDDAHHVVHHLLTGESTGYYASYSENATRMLARALSEGFVFQGQEDPAKPGRIRGEPSGDLPSERFVFFLQNHDQIGNRAMGERLPALGVEPRALRAAVALQLLTPQIPLVFMGEEQGATTPFLYFTSHAQPELASAVREGRRKEFAGFPAFADPEARSRIPDPNAESTWRQSFVPEGHDPVADGWRQWYRRLLALRSKYIVPRLAGARSLGAYVVGQRAVLAMWRMGDGARLSVYCNLGPDPCPFSSRAKVEPTAVFFMGPWAESESPSDVLQNLPGYCVIAMLDTDQEHDHV